MKFTKTKILATLGPSTDTIENMEKLIDAGVDSFRLNFSHGNYDYFEKLFGIINKVCVSKSLPIATLIDLQGPKIRISELKEDHYILAKGEIIEITTQPIIGDNKKVSTTYKMLIDDVSIGDKILIDDGLLHLKVKEKKTDSILCEIIAGGILKPKKGINLPGTKLRTPAVTEKDFADLEFALKHRVDFIALSFVRNAKDITDLRKWLEEHNTHKQIIAKIEKPEAVDNFEEILKAADGIMIARGDLGVEMLPQEVPAIQKHIIRRCNAVGKLVITATQMFESMINNPVPTRAEASDVANAVWDGTDVVMLSGETSVGKYPSEAVRIMNDILLKTESDENLKCNHEHEIPISLVDNLFDAAGKGIASMACQIKAAAIVVFTHHGRKAKVISKFKPESPIIAISDDFETLNKLNLSWGIKSFFVNEFNDEEADTIKATKILTENSLVNKGDVIIITAGAPITDKGRRNWFRFHIIN